MKTSVVVFLVVLAHPASASVVEFTETFDGNGDFDSVNGAFSGLDNPDWWIIGDGELRDGGLAIVNKGPFVFGTVYDELIRPVIGRGSFTERVEIKSPYLGKLNVWSEPASTGTIILENYLDLRDNQRFNALFMVVTEYPEAKEGEWTVSLHITGSHDANSGNFITSVPQGPHIALEIHYDDALSQASFTYDNDINDNVAALTFGPFNYTGTFMETHETRLTFGAIAQGDANGLLDFWSIRQRPDSRGDFNSNGVLDAADIDLLSGAVRSGANEVTFDLNSDQLVDELDRTVWVESLRRTYFGDSNLDGEFSSADLVTIFQAGLYEDAIDGNSGWASGDWNGDAEFTTRDLVLAFQAGGYESGPRAVFVAVPEPSHGILLILGFGAVGIARRNQRARTRHMRAGPTR